MSENATRIIVHHYIDGASNLYFNLVCCIILIVIFVLVLGIILSIVIYLVISLKKSQQLAMDQSLKRVTTRREKHVARNVIKDSSSYNGVGTSVSTSQEMDAGTDSNMQSIPLNTFRRHSVTNAVVGDTSASSAGLYDVLFPKHEHDIIHDAPKKLVTFAGQVYASGESSPRTSLINRPSTSGTFAGQVYASSESSSRTNLINRPSTSGTFAGQVYASGESSSRTNLINRPSTSGTRCDSASVVHARVPCNSTCDSASGSLDLDWDYFQNRTPIGSVRSEYESETEVKQIEPFCWQI